MKVKDKTSKEELKVWNKKDQDDSGEDREEAFDIEDLLEEEEYA